MNGAVDALSELTINGVKMPKELIVGIKDSVDCNVYFFDTLVSEWQMFLYIGLFTFTILGVYILLTVLKKKYK